MLALDANWKKAILAPAPRLAFSEGDSTGTVEAGQDLVITGIPGAEPAIYAVCSPSSPTPWCSMNLLRYSKR